MAENGVFIGAQRCSRVHRRLARLCCRSQRRVLVNLAVLHDHDEVLRRIAKQVEVGERVAVDQQQVGQRTGLNDTEPSRVRIARPTSAASRRRLKPCSLRISISTYTSFAIDGASEIADSLNSVYQFSIAALYRFTSAADSGRPDHAERTLRSHEGSAASGPSGASVACAARSRERRRCTTTRRWLPCAERSQRTRRGIKAAVVALGMRRPWPGCRKPQRCSTGGGGLWFDPGTAACSPWRCSV
jgi:hypothetical protein